MNVQTDYRMFFVNKRTNVRIICWNVESYNNMNSFTLFSIHSLTNHILHAIQICVFLTYMQVFPDITLSRYASHFATCA